VYYKCVKFHKNPMSRLWGVALTKEYGCCPKFKRGDNSTYTFTKRGGDMYLVSATPTKLLIEFLWSFTPTVVHNLQMCMELRLQGTCPFSWKYKLNYLLF
jgi:hypothetical protein